MEHPVFFQGCDHVFPLRYTTWTLKSTPPLWSTPFFFKAVTMFFPRGTQHGRLQSINKQESQLRYPICQIFQPTSRLYNNFTKQETTGYATCQISWSTLIIARVHSLLIRYRISQFCKTFTRLKRALDPSVRRWDRWCIPLLPAPFHRSACVSSAPRDSKELGHTCRHNAQHKKKGRTNNSESLYIREKHL